MYIYIYIYIYSTICDGIYTIHFRLQQLIRNNTDSNLLLLQCKVRQLAWELTNQTDQSQHTYTAGQKPKHAFGGDDVDLQPRRNLKWQGVHSNIDIDMEGGEGGTDVIIIT